MYFTPCSSVSIVNFEHVIAGWGGRSQYNYRVYSHRDFPLSNNYLDDVFKFKDLLGLEKTKPKI